MEKRHILATHISTRGKRALFWLGIHYLDQLANISDKDLMEMPHIGKKVLAEIREAQTRNGCVGVYHSPTFSQYDAWSMLRDCVNINEQFLDKIVAMAKSENRWRK